MTEYRIRYVDDALLDGRDWVLCDGFGDGITLYIRRGARKMCDADMEALLESAWEGYRNLVAVPKQRDYSAVT